MSRTVRLTHGARKPAEWVARRERGSTLLLKAMAFVSIRFGRRISRFFLYGIAIYFFLFAPAARRNSLPYLARALGRAPSSADRFRQMLYFCSTIHDRVFLINGRFDGFDIEVSGEQQVLDLLAAKRGAVLVGAHLGSFEVVYSLSRRVAQLRVAMAMYEENARKISTILAALNPAAQPDIVALGHVDAMLDIGERLRRGQFVGVLADRTLGAEPVHTVSFLGERAGLPLGPMRAAALLRCPVIFMAGLYRGGNRYRVVFDPIADFDNVERGQREAAMHAAIERYAALLEGYCRSDPYNWFNFYDFWHAHTAA